MADEPPLARSAADWRTDLACILAAALACHLLALAFDLNESLLRVFVRYERWQLDELPLTGMVFAFGLAWYALRRRRDSEAALRWRVQAESRGAALLAHNRELARQLIAVQESERLALARELHDELGQRCSAILIETATLRAGGVGERANWQAAATRADLAAQSLYQLVAGMLRRLRPADLDSLGLVAALQELCEAWEERSGVACVFQREDLGAALPEQINMAVYRVTQEALTNVMRHARATHVRVRLTTSGPAGLCLAVSDDGCGMDPARITRGLGLLGATERAVALGGELQVESEPGSGLRVKLRIPLPAPSRQPVLPTHASTA